MESLVLSLQSDALDETANVSQLLRKARALAVKLDSPDLDEWISCELKGYEPDAEFPEYRKIVGRPMYKNPYHGLQPILVGDDFTGNLISSRNLTQSVAELESLTGSDGTIFLSFPEEIRNFIIEEAGVPTEPMLVIQRANVIGVLDAVRNTILEWALELEKKGVLGDGLRFSGSDRENATAANYVITNNIGSMHGSSIQQAGRDIEIAQILNDMETLLPLLQKIGNDIDELSIDVASQNEMRAEIATIQAQAKSPKPRVAVIDSALGSIKAILEAAAGNVTAAAYLSELGQFG